MIGASYLTEGDTAPLIYASPIHHTVRNVVTDEECTGEMGGGRGDTKRREPTSIKWPPFPISAALRGDRRLYPSAIAFRKCPNLLADFAENEPPNHNGFIADIHIPLPGTVPDFFKWQPLPCELKGRIL